MGERKGQKGKSANTLGDIGKRARALSEGFPGSAYLREQMAQAEHAVLSHLQTRLDSLNEAGTAKAAAEEGAKTPGEPRKRRRTSSLSERFARMLEASMNQTPESALEAYFEKLLDELVPDEVRLLNAASDEKPIAIVHIEVSSRMGSDGGRAMSYLSRVGNEAGVMRNELTPQYLSHLVSMGLLEEVSAATSDVSKYELIESGSEVRKFMEQVRRQKIGKPRAMRSGLVLSGLGKDFMTMCSGAQR